MWEEDAVAMLATLVQLLQWKRIHTIRAPALQLRALRIPMVFTFQVAAAAMLATQAP